MHVQFDVLMHESLSEDFPTKFTWNPSLKLWTKRVRNVFMYGRMVNIHPANVEIFHLRLLLKNRKSAKSFKKLQTIDGVNMGPTEQLNCFEFMQE